MRENLMSGLGRGSRKRGENHRACSLLHYRAVTSRGDTLDFYLSTRRNTASAKRFLAKTLRSTAHCGPPRVINTDKNPALAAAITELKTDGRCPTSVRHRRVKYLNNRIEGDHGRLKRILGPKRGFKTPVTAYRTLKGIEAMHALRKGQGRIFALRTLEPGRGDRREGVHLRLSTARA